MNPRSRKTSRGKGIIPANTEAISQTGETKKRKIGISSIGFPGEKPHSRQVFLFPDHFRPFFIFIFIASFSMTYDLHFLSILSKYYEFNR
jgi:uncharacterized membrane protein YagU involved in acid resistance